MQPLTQSLPTVRGEIALREGSVADAAQYRALRLHGLQDAPTAFSADYAANAAQPMSFWEGRLTFDEFGTIFFGVHTGQLIGMTGIRQGESPKTQHGAYIWGVYVRPEWRGLHLAEALIENCATWARARGVKIVKLGVMTNNGPAIRCYERCGFQIYGTEPRCLLYAGQYYDEYLMFRDI